MSRGDARKLFAQELIDTGDLRLDLDEIADVVRSMNSAEFYDLLIHQRGWSSIPFENWLANTGAASSSTTTTKRFD